MIVIVGPTAVGKTRLAVELAKREGNIELINADSRQVLKTLKVATFAPSPAEMDGIRCHCLDLAAPGERFSVADWLAHARSAQRDIESRGAIPLVVGGTGLYVSALIDGYDLDEERVDEQRRAKLNTTAQTAEGLASLVAQVKERDPAGAASLDLNNPRRVIRALEILDRHPSIAAGKRRGKSQPALWLGIDAAAELHQAWINDRALQLVNGGALQREVENALESGISRAAIDAAGIGYREMLDMIDGTISRTDAVATIAQRTRRYAKAQRTWFRRDARIEWMVRAAEANFDDLVEWALARVRSR